MSSQEIKILHFLCECVCFKMAKHDNSSVNDAEHEIDFLDFFDLFAKLAKEIQILTLFLTKH